jgi:hypothetical protein
MADPQTDWMLAVFRDRTTMAHERYYKHPIDRVWEAVTNTELDGRPLFSLGGPAEKTIGDTVTGFRPPSIVQHTFTNPYSSVRFELAEAHHLLPYGHVDATEGTGTHLWLIHFATPVADDGSHRAHEHPDRPAGLAAPWRSAFVAGLHEFLDHLGLWLDGRWGDEDNVAYHSTNAGRDQRARWVDFYRRYIEENCPPS